MRIFGNRIAWPLLVVGQRAGRMNFLVLPARASLARNAAAGDPTTTIGSYTISSSGIITYNYGPGNAFAFYAVPEAGTIATAPGTYDFYEGADGAGGPCTSFRPVKIEASAAGCT
jgi:hypothetical protein